MNRKIQETDRLFIIARYKRDPHAFNAHTEAEKYDVSLRTIHGVLTKAGIKMQRGRKPLIPTESGDTHRVSGDAMGSRVISPEPPPFKGVDDETFARIEAARAAPSLEPLNPLDMLNLVNHLNHPKPPITPRKGPPVIRPSKPTP